MAVKSLFLTELKNTVGPQFNEPLFNEFRDLKKFLMKTNKNESKTPYLTNNKPRINELFELPIFFFLLSLNGKNFWLPF